MEFKAGWIRPEFNLMSLALSCLQVKKFYPQVTLYSDDVAAKMLIDTLKLPYDNLICELDVLNKYHPQLWALPKIYTYGKQETPFLHVDGDVFIWKEFDEILLQGQLIAQNEEAATDYYEAIIQSLEKELSYFPPEIISERASKESLHAFNAGIMGGRDVDFFKTFSEKAFQFIERNKNDFSRINVSSFNIFFEQYLFYCLAKNAGKQVSVLINEVIFDNRYKDLGNFIDVPHIKKYLHLIGNYKRNRQTCEQLANRLRQDYPEHYYRIIALFKSNKVPLLRDYYWFEADFSEQNLLDKHNLLQETFFNKKLALNDETAISNPVLNESVYFRGLLLKPLIDSARTNELIGNFPKNADLFLEDINQFENALLGIVKMKFSVISKNYLLARDTGRAKFSEYIFGNPQTTYERSIVADRLTERIKSQFDWTPLDELDGSLQITIDKLGDQEPSIVYTLVTPEYDQIGYSLDSIDELDCLLLETLCEPKTIRELFKQIEYAFDPEDLANSKSEFEKLIFGRIKKGFQNKSIEAVMDTY